MDEAKVEELLKNGIEYFVPRLPHWLNLFLHYTPPPVRASLSLASVHSPALRLLSFHLTTNTCFSVVVVRVQKHSLTQH